MLNDVARQIDRAFPGSVERLKDLLRIPSVGTDPAYRAETRRCAEWCADQLTGIGFEARPTDRRPCHGGGAPARSTGSGGPHVLYYGHYDVQPADPVELWDEPALRAELVEGPRGPRVVARGAVDDKGQVMTFVEAFRAWQDARRPAGAGHGADRGRGGNRQHQPRALPREPTRTS